MKEKLKILIVEDEALSAILLGRYLKNLGCDGGKPVATGREAILRAEELGPDVIFMDIRLADDIDGIEAARVILEKRATKIVFMSAYTDTEIYHKAMTLNPLTYLVKPFEFETIGELLESVDANQQKNI